MIKISTKLFSWAIFFAWLSIFYLNLSKIEKVPRGIQGEHRVKTWQFRGIWSQQSEHKQVQKGWMEPGVCLDWLFVFSLN